MCLSLHHTLKRDCDVPRTLSTSATLSLRICSGHMPIFREFSHRTNHKTIWSSSNFSMTVQQLRNSGGGFTALKIGCLELRMFRKDTARAGLVPESLSNGSSARWKRSCAMGDVWTECDMVGRTTVSLSQHRILGGKLGYDSGICKLLQCCQRARESTT